MGHLGLTPQSINAFGSYATRCKTSDEAEIVLENALKLEEAGCFSIVLEKIPASLWRLYPSLFAFQALGLVLDQAVMVRYL